MSHKLNLRRVNGSYAIARLEAGSSVPSWANGPGFMATVHADDELTIVCAAQRIPPEVQSDGPWVCLRSIGPFDFQATGIVASLVAPLSAAGIGVFVLCTFDGEHLLVAEQDFEPAIATLTAAGHVLRS